MTWYFAVIEGEHELQNPTSSDKVRLLGERLGLRRGTRLLDVASGRGGPAVLLASAFGCRVTCIEQAAEFDRVARERAHAAGVGALIEHLHADAARTPFEPEAFDAAMCLGASFIWGGLEGTLAALSPAVRRGGYVAVGEPYWRTWPLPEGCDPEGGDYATLPETVARFAASGLVPVALIDASLDDWDRYESLHWRTAERWLRDHPHDPAAPGIRARYERDRDHYLRWQRDLMGWAIIAGRKP
jgi:SAM-dependent methyltransferase